MLPAALNIGDAYSRGLESEFYFLATTHVTTQLAYTYNQTKLTSLNPLFVVPNVSVPPPAIGSPLSGTPKNSVALTLEYGHIEVVEGN